MKLACNGCEALQILRTGAYRMVVSDWTMPEMDGLQLCREIRAGDFPTFAVFDNFAVIAAPGGSLSISKFSSPPLNAGRYFYGIYNPNPTPQTVSIRPGQGLRMQMLPALPDPLGTSSPFSS